MRDVKGALGQIIERVEDHPQEAASLGILSKDLTALKADLARPSHGSAPAPAPAPRSERQSKARWWTPRCAPERR